MIEQRDQLEKILASTLLKIQGLQSTVIQIQQLSETAEEIGSPLNLG
jgi:hypothetical protein